MNWLTDQGIEIIDHGTPDDGSVEMVVALITQITPTHWHKRFQKATPWAF